jgi:HSP20 family protein
MPKKKKKELAVKKDKVPVPAVKEPQPESIQEFNKLLDTFRNEIVWDPFRGFELTEEYEPPIRIPYVDVIDSGKEYLVKAEIPGVKKENVEIDVGSNELLLTAKSDVEQEETGRNYLHRERAFSTYRRYIGFADVVDTGKVSASITDGVLQVKLPKLEPLPEKKTRKLKPA